MTDTSLIEAVADRLSRMPALGPTSAHIRQMIAEATVSAVRLWEADNGWRCVPVKATLGQALGTPSMKREEDMDRICADYAAQVSASPPPPGSVKEYKE